MAKAKSFHVHCNLPNASNLINGVEFAPHEKGGVRTVAPVDADVAENFNKIKGYSVLPAKAVPAAEVDPPEPPADPVAPIATASEDTNGQASLLPSE